MVLYDFDKMFDGKIASEIKKNMSKHTEEEWENIIPKLYEEFGNTKLEQINATPNEYYNNMTASQLAEVLKEHLLQKIEVSEFLIKAVENKNAYKYLTDLLQSDEKTVHFALTIFGNRDIALPYYIEILKDDDYDEHLKEHVLDFLKQKADVVKEDVLKLYYDYPDLNEYCLEILSLTTDKDKRVLSILTQEFLNNLDKIPQYANFLAEFNDERALPYLIKQIKKVEINYQDYTELSYAIEALGGTYDERDFSSDEVYKKIKEESEKQGEVFKEE